MTDEGADVASKTRAFRRAVDFLNDQSRIVYKWHKTFAPVPDIDLGPGGSVDLHWKAPDSGIVNKHSVRSQSGKRHFTAIREIHVFSSKAVLTRLLLITGIALWLMKNQGSR